MTKRGATLARALRLARYLHGRRYRPEVTILATQLQVTTRTVYRDLAALQEAHYRVPPTRREVEATW